MPERDGEVEAVRRAFAIVWEAFFSAVPEGWARHEADAIAAVSGVPMASLNGVWVTGPSAEPELVASLLDEVRAAGVPHCLQAAPVAALELAEVASDRALSPDEAVPLMATRGAAVRAPADPEGLRIRELGPHEADAHGTLADLGFETGVPILARLVSPQVLAVPGTRCYLGEVGGEPVTTGIGATVAGQVAIFNVATPPEHRRRGYGAAVTARAARDGFEAGARRAWLQSSSAGLSVYERLGFETLESWSCWISD